MQLNYESPAQFTLSKNLISADLDNHIIQNKLAADLKVGRIIATSPSLPYIYSPLNLIPKYNKGWRRIHHFSHPLNRLINDYIQSDFATFKYITLKEI